MAAPSSWNGSLRVNEVFSAIYNMIINQQVYADNIGNTFTSLVDRARIDGTLFGDTYLKYATNALQTYKFDVDTTNQANVLELHRPSAPHVQAISLTEFRQIPITLDSYFTKRAFSTPAAFADFNSVTLQWLRDTKRIYDATTYNAYIGTVTTSEGSQTQEADISGITAASTTIDAEAKRRLVTEIVAQKIADIMTGLKDIGTGYNDLGYYRAYNPEDMIIVWNADWVNYMRKTGLPTIFNADGLVNVKEENVLPAKYFGTVDSGTTTGAGDKALVEMTISGTHYWPGETITTGSTVTASTTYNPTAAVEANGSIICKIMHKDSVPYMSGFETETTFVNGRNLSENHYLTFGHNKLQYLYNYPMITVKCKA